MTNSRCHFGWTFWSNQAATGFRISGKKDLFIDFLLQSGEKKKDDETVDSLGMNFFLLPFGLKQRLQTL